MPLSEPKIYSLDDAGGDGLLRSLGISRKSLKAVALAAHGERSRATPFHPNNAEGMYAYLGGVAELRVQVVSDLWEAVTVRNVEMVRNAASRVQIGFWNVNVAAREDTIPTRISNEGPVTHEIREVNGQLTLDLGDPGQNHASGNRMLLKLPSQSGEYHTMVFMVAEDGSSELGLPGPDGSLLERVFICGAQTDEPTAESKDGEAPSGDDNSDAEDDNYDINVKRR